MTENLFDYQIQAMQKMKKLHEALNDKPMDTAVSLNAFQQSMIQVGTKFWQNMMNNPHHIFEAQQKYLEFLQSPVTNDNNYERYFKSEMWGLTPYYQWLKDTYIKTAEWMIETIEEEALGFEGDDKDKLLFLTRQIIEGMNPRNFPLTNPDVIEETINTKGENFLRGMDNLINDIERGSMSMTDDTAFELGKNIATTKGYVVYSNKMMELLCFPATTDKAFKEPLVIIPPWINKYYILDLTPENSMIKWLTDQGHNVFCISWANPDESFRDIGFKDYMHDGALKAIEIANKTCNTDKSNVVGYCIGGTLLSMTQAWLEGKKRKSPINSATYLTTLLDFEKAGDLRVFIDKDQIQTLKQTLQQNGIMDGKAMSLSFSLLRASDLIWSFVINNYFMGKSPVPFDLLYWNSDSTNLPATMHCDYLQSMYLDNALAKGEYVLDGVKLDLSKIKTPTYYLYTQDDHIAPADACKDSVNLLGGSKDKAVVMGGSGHIAGVINPPYKNKYHYIINDKKHDGSWWTNWQTWLKSNNKPMVKTKGFINIQCLPPAPGTYLKKKI